MKVRSPLSPAVIAVLTALVLVPQAQAYTIIYHHDFDGGAASLNGTAVDVGTGNWVATPTNFLANGTIGGTAAGTATLAFNPLSGLIYNLDASFTGISGDGNWIPFGFVNGQGTSSNVAQPNENRFLEGQTVGVAWMFALGNNSANLNPAILGDPSSAVGNNGLIDRAAWLGGPTNGGDMDMRIVLDTTGGAGNWTATWFAKRPTDGSYTMVRGTETLLNESITSVGFGKSNTGISGTIESFSLSIVPEPSTGLLLALGGLGFLGRRRR